MPFLSYSFFIRLIESSKLTGRKLWQKSGVQFVVKRLILGILVLNIARNAAYGIVTIAPGQAELNAQNVNPIP